MMRKLALAVALFGSAMSPPATAQTILDLPANGVDGDCSFNTACGPQSTGNTFAAQQFTLPGTTAITGATFTAYSDPMTKPHAVNWLFLAADAKGGAPGTVLFAGTSLVTSRFRVGAGFGLDLVRSGFDLAGISLGAGSYYFGFQAVSPDRRVYLAYADGVGAAQSNDGGASWAVGYRQSTAVAVSLATSAISAVPEPGSWAMMVSGLGAIGCGLRRRRRRHPVDDAAGCRS